MIVVEIQAIVVKLELESKSDVACGPAGFGLCGLNLHGVTSGLERGTFPLRHLGV